MASSGMLHRVALVRTDVSEGLSAYIIKMTRIGEIGTYAATSIRCEEIQSYLAITSNRSKLRLTLFLVH
jgi:DNA-binding TFAR19-related protein (PDSD5 family)